MRIMPLREAALNPGKHLHTRRVIIAISKVSIWEFAVTGYSFEKTGSYSFTQKIQGWRLIRKTVQIQTATWVLYNQRAKASEDFSFFFLTTCAWRKLKKLTVSPWNLAYSQQNLGHVKGIQEYLASIRTLYSGLICKFHGLVSKLHEWKDQIRWQEDLLPPAEALSPPPKWFSKSRRSSGKRGSGCITRKNHPNQQPPYVSRMQLLLLQQLIKKQPTEVGVLCS